jgi:serine/threonine protein kinase
MPAWTGKTINNVTLGEMIARGGMAEVYFGEHTSLNRMVAVKIMRDHVDNDPETRSRFEREAKVIANLRHPNIIQIYDYTLADGQPCLMMELVPGVSLGAYLKSLHKQGEKLPVEVIARMLSALASAVDYAHDQHLVHRDIKPANVLLRAKNPVQVDEPLPSDVEPVLTDFGLVRLLDSTIQTSTGTVSGTPAYMSPEQARGEKVDRQTDIYSLGVMLYEMLAGAVPFDAESSFGVLMKHLNEPPPSIEGISANLQAVINRALAKDPVHRYSTAGELAEEFNAVFNGQTLSSLTLNLPQDPVPAAEVTPPVPAKIPAWIPIGIGVLALSIIGFFALRPPALAPAANPDQPIGRITFTDFNFGMDKATLTTSALPAPKTGTHYEVWFLAEGGETRRNVGTISMDEFSQGTLTFIEPDQKNLLGLYDQVEVTLETDNDPKPDEPSDNVVASSVFPPLSLTHVRHVLVSFHGAPEAEALIQGMWVTVDEVDTSMIELEKAFKAGDEDLLRRHTEEVINQLAGSGNMELYRDWDEDGNINDESDGFGLLENGGGAGYLPAVISHSFFAADAIDATENIKLHSAHTIICAENVQGWSEQILRLALQLQEMPFNTEMEPLILEMRTLADNALYGVDTNGNGIIEPVLGEGGADTAYEYAYNMSDMPLLMGVHRIPPPAKTP